MLLPVLAGAALQQATASGDIEFNCPWCNTRLALSPNDFRNERAVMCPRCNNPIDLDIQRRLARTAPVGRPTAPPSAPPSPVMETKRKVTVPKSSPPSYEKGPPEKTQTRERLEHQIPAAAPTHEPAATPLNAPALQKKVDWSIDIDSKFGSMPASGGSVLDAARGSQGTGVQPVPTSGTRRCASCGFENPRVSPEFSFGSTLKCAWCSKPLPSQ
ncbi:MAG TPA: hypothetical protein VJ547_07760 [Candidatus Thermoplasmatota archaeon]|nr:hypothetical protein [Candidatus Thermoplasmatota archaeon]